MSSEGLPRAMTPTISPGRLAGDCGDITTAAAPGCAGSPSPAALAVGAATGAGNSRCQSALEVGASTAGPGCTAGGKLSSKPALPVGNLPPRMPGDARSSAGGRLPGTRLVGNESVPAGATGGSTGTVNSVGGIPAWKSAGNGVAANGSRESTPGEAPSPTASGRSPSCSPPGPAASRATLSPPGTVCSFGGGTWFLSGVGRFPGAFTELVRTLELLEESAALRRVVLGAVRAVWKNPRKGDGSSSGRRDSRRVLPSFRSSAVPVMAAERPAKSPLATDSPDVAFTMRPSSMGLPSIPQLSELPNPHEESIPCFPAGSLEAVPQTSSGFPFMTSHRPAVRRDWPCCPWAAACGCCKRRAKRNSEWEEKSRMTENRPGECIAEARILLRLR